MKNIKYLLLLIFFCSCSSSDNEMNDVIMEEINDQEIVDFGNEILNIQFPSNFASEELKYHVILSDSIGNLIDYNTYQNSSANTDLKFYTEEEFDDRTPFSVTFIAIYRGSVHGIISYSDLTNASLEKNILLKPRGFSKSTLLVDMEATKLDKDYILNASGHGYSMVRIDDALTGHYTSEFNQNLGSKNVFIKYYDPNDVTNDRYKWAMIENPSSISEITEDYLTSDNVTFKQLSTNVPSELPLLLMYGYENDDLFNNICGHRIYDTYVPVFGFVTNHYYSFPEIFEKTSYSLAFSNYTLFGLGTPPDVVNVPNKSVSCSLIGNEFAFSGDEDFEVGRISLDNVGLGLNISFVFDGQSKNIVIPKIPEGLVSDDIRQALNDGDLRLIQAVAENNEAFENYSDYLNNVFKNSSPFYINSPTRERIFKSYISTQPLPIGEFPYLESFR